MKRGLSLVVVAIWTALPLITFAHPGRLDKNGCHHDRKRGGYHCHRGQGASDKQAPKKQPKDSAQSDVLVSFNTESLKYHNPTCKWALRCTKNCIEVTLADAISRGGVACKVCGGH